MKQPGSLEHIINGGVESLPTILRSGPYRFFFYSHEPHEPPHVHLARDLNTAKFWLAPVALAGNVGFSPVELRRIQWLVRLHETEFPEAWDAYFEQ